MSKDLEPRQVLSSLLSITSHRLNLLSCHPRRPMGFFNQYRRSWFTLRAHPVTSQSHTTTHPQRTPKHAAAPFSPDKAYSGSWLQHVILHRTCEARSRDLFCRIAAKPPFKRSIILYCYLHARERCWLHLSPRATTSSLPAIQLKTASSSSPS